MSDPFRPETNHTVLREARVGLVVLAVTLGVFCYVAYHRIVVSGTDLPEHVLNAPIAEMVWPGEDPPNATRGKEQLDFQTTFGNMITGARKSFGMDWGGAKSQRDIPQSKVAIPSGHQAAARTPESSTPPRREPVEFDLASIQQHLPNGINDTTSTQFGMTKTAPRKLPLDVNELRPPESKSPFDETSIPNQTVSMSPQREQEKNLTTGLTIVGQSSDFNSDFAAAPNPRTAAITSGPTSSVVSRTHVAEPQPNHSFLQGNQVETLNSPLPPLQNDNRDKKITADIAFDFDENVDSEVPSEIALSSYQGQIENPNHTTNQEFVATLNENAPESDFATAASLTDDPTLEYEVRAGDSFWAISQNVYDDGRFFRALFEHNRNRIQSFEDLTAGTIIATPRKEELARLWPELCPRDENSNAAVTDIDQRIYVTQTGDTLFEIARQKLGQASLYFEILKLNASKLGENVTHLSPLPPGVRLILPYSDL